MSSSLHRTQTRYTAADFESEVRRMTNDELVEKAGSEILGAAIMSRFPRHDTGKSDAWCDAILAEAKRRGNTDLYERGWNAAVRSQGHTSMVHKIATPLSVGEEMREAGSDA